jgi:hypothetical protein
MSRTPNEMLGRVTSVNTMFTGTSACWAISARADGDLVGAVPAVLIGGPALRWRVTLLWMRSSRVTKDR